MPTYQLTMKSLQLFTSCLLLALSLENGSLVLAKPSVPNQSPWKQLPPNNGEKTKESNRIPMDHDVTNNTTTEKKREEYDMSKRFTIIRDNLANAFGGRHCLENAIHLCDLRSFASLVTPSDMTPCNLMMNFQTCVGQETALCLDPDVILLKTSLTSLMQGFHANGKCHQVPLMFPDALMVNGDVEECKPEQTWACALQLVSNLKGPHDKTCDAILQFRNCIRSRTHSCGYTGARFLVDGVQGLVWTFKKGDYCK